MNLFQNKLAEVSQHFANDDTSLGYRKLLDCVLDSQDLDLYRSVIAIEEYKEKNEQAKDLIDKYKEILSRLEQKTIDNVDQDSILLRAKSLLKRYGRNAFKLGEIDLDIHKGQVLGLVGENGNGKTTLLRILAKEIKYNSGTIEYFFIDKYSQTFDLRTKLTYLPQRTPTWYGSLMNNLKYCASSYGIHGEENELITQMMVIRFGLWKYRKLKWSELSSGYKMRFELARTFLRRPEILLLDEPLANLDVVSQQLILEDLKNMARSISSPLGIILSSQQLHEVEKISDNVIFLKHGVPADLNSSFANNSEKNFILELETKSSKELIVSALSNMDIVHLHFNGGMYIIEFSQSHSTQEVLTALLQGKVELNYFRDISNSTKRLFHN